MAEYDPEMSVIEGAGRALDGIAARLATPFAAGDVAFDLLMATAA